MSNPSALVRRVDKYDGQVVTCDGQPAYELGSFLGSGATGVYVLGPTPPWAARPRPLLRPCSVQSVLIRLVRSVYEAINLRTGEVSPARRLVAVGNHAFSAPLFAGGRIVTRPAAPGHCNQDIESYWVQAHAL